MIKQLSIYALKIVRFLIGPVAVFSFLSATLIVVLSDYSEYVMGQESHAPFILWGEAITVVILTFLLCGTAFGFAPSSSRNSLFDVTAASIQVGIIYYVAFSLLSLSYFILWISFQVGGTDLENLRPGRVFALNAVACTLLVVSLAFFSRAGQTNMGLSSPEMEALGSLKGRRFRGVTAGPVDGLPFLVFGLLALGLGVHPILSALLDAASF